MKSWMRWLACGGALMALAAACSEDDEPLFPADALPADFVPEGGGMRRLLGSEYLSSIELVLGPEASAAAEAPPDIAQAGFDAVGATLLSLSGQPIETYERSAFAAANAAIKSKDRIAEWAPCMRQVMPDEACFEEIAINVGRMLWRRPLLDEEVASLVEVATFADSWARDEGQDPRVLSMTYEVSAMLQSPNFLYITTVGEEDAATGLRKLSSYELAARLSFALVGRTPDAELLDVAERGTLSTYDEIRAEAERLLDMPEAKDALAQYFDELFRLRFLASTPKNADLFPAWNEDIAAAMRTETQMLLEDVVWNNDADIRDIFTADYTFLNAELAEFYDVDGSFGDDFERTPWPASQRRAGILSQGAFLSHQSGPRRTSPTKRGKFVLQFVLCLAAPPPPDDVVPDLPEPPPGGATIQQLLEQHMEDPACAGCHASTDPIGFAFEIYDSVGRFRTKDEGLPIDGSGSTQALGSWDSPQALGERITENERVTECMVRNLIRGKIGHPDVAGEKPLIDQIDQRFQEDGGSFRSLLLEFVTNPLFRFVGDPR